MSSKQVRLAMSLRPEEVGSALQKIPEDQWFDRKGPRVSEQKLANLEVGLANADGGTVVIGLSEKGVEGTDRYHAHRNELMKAGVKLTEPPVRCKTELIDCVDEQGHPDHLLVIEVEPGDVVHANQRDEVFLRVGDENRKLLHRQRQELFFDKGQASFEATPVHDATYEDLDPTLVTDYAKSIGHPHPARLLGARSLVNSKGQINAAAILLFGRQPQAYFPEAYVRVLRYRGTEKGAGRRQQLMSDVRCEGAIPHQLEQAVIAVESLQPARRALGKSGRFESIGLIPKDAWLEGLVNAVIHRSYSLGGDHIRVEIFDDRMEIESPGRFPGLVNPAEPFESTRFAKNPRIARICSDLEFGQELGEGIRRMFEEMRLAGLADPQYRQTEASVRLTLMTAAVDRDLESMLPTRSRELLFLLHQTPQKQLSTGDVADSMGLSRPAALVRLRALERAGLIEWMGSSPKDPRAQWKLTKD